MSTDDATCHKSHLSPPPSWNYRLIIDLVGGGYKYRESAFDREIFRFPVEIHYVFGIILDPKTTASTW